VAWIKWIEEEEAAGKLKEYYEHIRRTLAR
jgi:hypothetical protein